MNLFHCTPVPQSPTRRARTIASRTTYRASLLAAHENAVSPRAARNDNNYIHMHRKDMHIHMHHECPSPRGKEAQLDCCPRERTPPRAAHAHTHMR